MSLPRGRKSVFTHSSRYQKQFVESLLTLVEPSLLPSSCRVDSIRLEIWILSPRQIGPSGLVSSVGHFIFPFSSPIVSLTRLSVFLLFESRDDVDGSITHPTPVFSRETPSNTLERDWSEPGPSLGTTRLLPTPEVTGLYTNWWLRFLERYISVIFTVYLILRVINLYSELSILLLSFRADSHFRNIRREPPTFRTPENGNHWFTEPQSPIRLCPPIPDPFRRFVSRLYLRSISTTLVSPCVIFPQDPVTSGW